MNIKTFDSRPVALPIKKIIRENDSVNTYVFDYYLGSKPGQFIMMWIPGVDEKPLSIAFDDGNEFWITVCNVGGATAELFKLKEGDKVGIRGPFGTSYKVKEGDHLALVAGGYGAAPMYAVAHEASKKGCGVEFFIGARNKDLLLYTQKILGLANSVRLHIVTNDGSVGYKGFVTDVLKDVLKKQASAKDPSASLSKNFDPRVPFSTLRSKFSSRLASGSFAEASKEKVNKIFTCGPEVMMKAVGAIADENNVECYLSVERYMKCGIGVCGQCAVDDTGDLCCIKGPVMPWKYVKKLAEFGKYHRDAQGKKHYF